MTVNSNETTTTTKSVSKFEETLYVEEVKQWIKDSRSLRSILTSLNNIVGVSVVR